MTKAERAVLAEALRPDPDARAERAAELPGRPDGPPDPDVQAAWTLAIDRRVAALDTGTVRIESREDAKRRIEREIPGR